MEKHQIDILNSILSSFSKITLPEMGSFSLLKRFDSKFILKESDFYNILSNLSSDYAGFWHNESFLSTYSSLYFDTDNFDFYLQHHNQKNNRCKIRFRNYVESNLSFLEIKQKSKNGLSKKTRILGDFKANHFSTEQVKFMEKLIPEIKAEKLFPILNNRFTRVTLVSKKENERLTFDLNINFEHQNKTTSIPNFVVAELKQENKNSNSAFLQQLKTYGIREQNFSKYCIGLSILNHKIKRNNFKPILLKIDQWNS